MITKVQIWVNNLALRIPKAFAYDAQNENDGVVDVSCVDGQIVEKTIVAKKWSLDELLAGVNADNIHCETDTDFAVGKEVW